LIKKTEDPGHNVPEMPVSRATSPTHPVKKKYLKVTESTVVAATEPPVKASNLVPTNPPGLSITAEDAAYPKGTGSTLIVLRRVADTMYEVNIISSSKLSRWSEPITPKPKKINTYDPPRQVAEGKYKVGEIHYAIEGSKRRRYGR
jgi:hypothetical protein